MCIGKKVTFCPPASCWAVIGNNCRIGNFVEVKKSTVGEASKVNHLS